MRCFVISICLLLSSASCASGITNCANPINTIETRQCAEASLKVMKKNMENEVNIIAHELISFNGKNNSGSFIELQRQWLELVEAQCLHQRALHGRGSIGGISYITCKELFYRERIKVLNALYKKVISIL